jgi:hypothetical protein
VSANIGNIRMKPINVFPMAVMLVVVLILGAWFGGYFS